jgi:DNA-binding SARP family transcriptional activator/LysM repeat protein
MSHVMPSSRARSWLSGTGALLALVILIVGVPLGLVVAVGWPLPHQVPSLDGLRSALTSRGIPDRVFLDILACVAWLAWASAVVSIIEETVAAVRGRSSKRIPVAGAFQPIAGRLVAIVLFAILSLARPQPASGPAVRTPLAAQLHIFQPETRQPDTHSAQLTADMETTTSAPIPAIPVNSQAQVPPASPTYTVVAHDTLWSIAQNQLGDPLQWREIFALNEGKPQPDGRTLTDPNWIYPGWVLALPASSTTAAPPTAPAPAPPVTASPPAATSPSSSIPPASSPSTAKPAQPHRTEQSGAPQTTSRRQADGIDPPGRRSTQSVQPIVLPSGSVVAPSFAAGVLAAVAVGRLRRRRRYRPSAPEPGRDLRRPVLGDTLSHLMRNAAEHSRLPDSDGDAITDFPLPADPEPIPQTRQASPRSSFGSDPTASGLIDIGTQGEEQISLDLGAHGVLCVAGSASEDVVRYWCTALLTHAGEGHAEVLTSASLASSLFSGLGPTNAIRAVSSPGGLLRSLEAEVVGRSRQLADAEVPDAASYRTACPEDPIPHLLVVSDRIPEEAADRWRIACTSAARLDVAVVVLGDHQMPGAQITVGPSGQVASATPKDLDDHLRGSKLFRLDPHEATELIGCVSPEPEEMPNKAHRVHLPDHASADASPVWPLEFVDQPEGSAKPIEVRILGPYHITARGEEIATGLRSAAKELLAWYLLRPEGAPAEAAVEALWPDTSPELVTKRFWRALGDLRSRLRAEGSSEKHELLTRSGDHYHPDTRTITCDLWDFQDQLHRAARTDDDREALIALRSAVDICRGDLVSDVDYPWVEPAREDLHRRVLDAHFRLAELEEISGHLEAATAMLRRAVQFDHYAEEGFRRLMALDGRLGRRDSIRATWSQLQRNLAELELDPEPETVRLYRELNRSDDLEHAGTSDR